MADISWYDKITYESDVVLSKLFNAKDETNEKIILAYESIQDVRESLSEVWHEVLGIKQVDKTDDFFNLGGDSLNAILMASIIQKKMNIKIPITDGRTIPHDVEGKCGRARVLLKKAPLKMSKNFNYNSLAGVLGESTLKITL